MENKQSLIAVGLTEEQADKFLSMGGNLETLASMSAAEVVAEIGVDNTIRARAILVSAKKALSAPAPIQTSSTADRALMALAQAPGDQVKLDCFRIDGPGDQENAKLDCFRIDEDDDEVHYVAARNHAEALSAYLGLLHGCSVEVFTVRRIPDDEVSNFEVGDSAEGDGKNLTLKECLEKARVSGVSQLLCTSKY